MKECSVLTYVYSMLLHGPQNNAWGTADSVAYFNRKTRPSARQAGIVADTPGHSGGPDISLNHGATCPTPFFMGIVRPIIV